MESSKQNETNCETPTKKIISFHGLLSQPLTSNYHTPPSRTSKVTNPFEHVLREHLGTNFISPSLFTRKSPVNKDFSWTIDELSALKPAEIDEHSNQFESPEREDSYDPVTQSRIDSYFSMQQILPSPMQHLDGALLPLPSPSTTTSMLCNSSYAQTVLTLPPTLPKEVEQILKPYFSFTEDQQECKQAQSHSDNLYNRLFDAPSTPQVAEGDYEDTDEFSSPVKLSPSYKNSTLYQRTIGTPGNYAAMNLCTLSPICLPVVSAKGERYSDKGPVEQIASQSNRNTSQVMSIDGSFSVPDYLNGENFNISQLDSSHHSSEGLSTSTTNWELEYRQMQSPLADTSIETMEISRLATPRQRLVHSQRKKLSNSFGTDIQSTEDDDDFMINSQQSMKVDENGESGYCTNQSIDQVYAASMATATAATATSTLWESVNVVSSTPTKRKENSR